jgi:hypothetical protein
LRVRLSTLTFCRLCVPSKTSANYHAGLSFVHCCLFLSLLNREFRRKSIYLQNLQKMLLPLVVRGGIAAPDIDRMRTQRRESKQS